MVVVTPLLLRSYGLFPASSNTFFVCVCVYNACGSLMFLGDFLGVCFCCSCWNAVYSADKSILHLIGLQHNKWCDVLVLRYDERSAILTIPQCTDACCRRTQICSIWCAFAIWKMCHLNAEYAINTSTIHPSSWVSITQSQRVNESVSALYCCHNSIPMIE